MAVFSWTTKDGKPVVAIGHVKDYKGFRDRRSFPWFLHIQVEMRTVTENGLPDGNESEELEAFQEVIFGRLAEVTTAHVLGRATGEGYRQIYAYLREAVAADAVLSIVARDAPAREFRFSIRKDPDWKYVAWMGL